MSFFFPWAWVWAASGLGVLLLALLRRREREYPVSALFLWERIPRDRARRIERLWTWVDPLVLLQLLAVLLFAFALAHPVLRLARPAGATALVLDASASMAAAGRAEEAVAAARRLVEDSTGPWAVVLWADPPRLLVPPTRDRDEVLSGLSAFQPTLGSRPPLGQALALLTGPWARTVVLTDDPPAEGGVEVLSLPPRDNLGITAFAVRPEPDGVGYTALVLVRNDSPRFQDVQVLLHTGVGTYAGSRLLEPWSQETVLFRLSGVGTAFRAELLPRDGFPWDNVRYFAFHGGAVRVRWVGEEDRYLLAALRAALPVEVAQEPPWDLTVAVRTTLAALPPGPALLVEASSPEALLGEPLPAGPVRGEGSPLLRHVAPEEFRFEQVRRVLLPPQAQVALWAGPHPALACWEAPQGRRVLLALDLGRSNLPVTVDFPVLVRNVVSWLLPLRPRPTLLVGEAVTLPAGAEVVTPAGRVAGVWVPDRPGMYDLIQGERREVLAVNVPPSESLLARGREGGIRSPPEQAWAEASAWTWIALGAFLLLGVEWLLALRRGGG